MGTNRMIQTVVSVVFVLIALMACGDQSTEKKEKAKKIGQVSYETYCVACHGDDGKLGLMAAKDLTLSKLSKEEIIEIVSNGKGTMTPFKNVLNESEIADLAAYVQTLKK